MTFVDQSGFEPGRWVAVVSRPVSGILWAPHRDRWPSICAVYPRVARRCDGRTGRPCPLLDLAPDGVYRAVRVAPDAGALLPHRFTLTCDRSPGPSAVCSLLHCPSGHPDLALASILPCGVPTSSTPARLRRPCRGHPADSPSRISATGRCADTVRSTAELVVDVRVGSRGLKVDREPLTLIVGSADDELDRRHRAERRRHRPHDRKPGGSAAGASPSNTGFTYPSGAPVIAIADVARGGSHRRRSASSSSASRAR